MRLIERVRARHHRVLHRHAGWLGIDLRRGHWREKVVSLVGGAVALYAVIAVSEHVLGFDGAQLLVASMGASAVLLFAVPHGAL